MRQVFHFSVKQISDLILLTPETADTLSEGLKQVQILGPLIVSLVKNKRFRIEFLSLCIHDQKKKYKFLNILGIRRCSRNASSSRPFPIRSGKRFKNP